MLITITGANVTKTAVVEVDLGEAYVNQHVALVRLADPGIRSWLHIWLTSERHGRAQLLNAAYGAGKPGLNLTNVRDVEVWLPPQEERAEIARRVDGLFAKADTIGSRIAQATRRADKLTQSTLAKAFRGELVPTEAELAHTEGRSYESAAELLERIRHSRQSQNGARAVRTRTRRCR